MKKNYPNSFLKYFVLLAFVLVASQLYAQTTAIPDPNFEQALINQGIDKDFTVNGQVANKDIENIEELDVSFNDIYDITGIEGFTNLKKLIINDNYIEAIDLTQNYELEYLDCAENLISILDLSNNSKLISVFVHGPRSNLSEIILTGLTSLENLSCADNYGLTEINLSSNSNLKYLTTSGTPIEILDVSNNTKLEYLDCVGNFDYMDISENGSIKELDLSNNNSLKTVFCSKNKIEKLTLNPMVETLDCSNNRLSQLDLMNATNLESLTCGINPISKLDLNNNINLKYLYCSDGVLEELLVEKTGLLERINCENNYLVDLNLNNNSNLAQLNANRNRLENLNVANGNNEILNYFNAQDNSNLICISVDNADAANAGIGTYANWTKGPSAIYSESCFALGIDDEILSSGLNIYPNPVSNSFTIESQTPIEKVEIYTVLGQKVIEKSSELSTVSTEVLSKGIYMLKVFSENGNTTRRLIKQ